MTAQALFTYSDTPQWFKGAASEPLFTKKKMPSSGYMNRRYNPKTVW